MFKQVKLKGSSTDSIPPLAYENNFGYGRTHYYQSLLLGEEYKGGGRGIRHLLKLENKVMYSKGKEDEVEDEGEVTSVLTEPRDSITRPTRRYHTSPNDGITTFHDGALENHLLSVSMSTHLGKRDCVERIPACGSHTTPAHQESCNTLIQHMEYVKKSTDKRALHKRDYNSRVNDRQMHITEEKVDTSKALDASLVDTESSRTKSKKLETSNRLGNDAHVDDVNINAIYDEEPMVEVQLTADNHVFATGQ
ncbi:hypothetical protein Tco_0655023 [Tanacetum coccineum]|uniref:Uncharacterized protein n=1 Tax=Tanacetum coccineum TaxID=301880 RepID=A0ABQ4X4W4_9ASTR